MAHVPELQAALQHTADRRYPVKRFRPWRLVPASVGVGVAALVAVIVLAGSGPASRPVESEVTVAPTASPPQGSSASDRPPPVRRVPREMAESFRVLRTAPLAPRSTDGSKSSLSYGANPDLARTVRRDSLVVTVTPGSAGLCLFEHRSGSRYGGGTCATLADAKAGRVVFSIFPGEQTSDASLVVGLVPDGVDHVVLRGPSGKATATIRVVDNVWIAVRPGVVKRAEISLPDGTSTTVTIGS